MPVQTHMYIYTYVCTYVCVYAYTEELQCLHQNILLSQFFDCWSSAQLCNDNNNNNSKHTNTNINIKVQAVLGGGLCTCMVALRSCDDHVIHSRV